ncbi:hypothetical protein D3C84_589670 [compost metagenome]
MHFANRVAEEGDAIVEVEKVLGFLLQRPAQAFIDGSGTLVAAYIAFDQIIAMSLVKLGERFGRHPAIEGAIGCLAVAKVVQLDISLNQRRSIALQMQFMQRS